MNLRGSLRAEGFSVRSILTFVIVVVVTAFLWAIFASKPAAAYEANWNGASIMYDGHQYYRAGTAAQGESHNLPVDAEYYVYIETITTNGVKTQKAHVIYFAPGADPPTATSATYVVYDYDATTKQYSNPSQTSPIEINPDGTSDQVATSCAIEGVGWIVCSISVFMAQGMDTVFTMLSGFMEVQPLQNSTTGDLYIAWNVMRNIANVAFIISFMIIIYSQITSIGVSNYGLKKLIPRLIIAAVAVNLSFFICALFIDISNVLGYSLQNIFIDIRNDIFNIDNDTWGESMVSWESIVGFVLSGGTATLAASVGIVTAIAGTGGTIVGAIFLLLPALLGLLLAILVVLLILAARQAIIVILVVLAPLAFVAYLLPNTEKWFTSWRGLFTTMLVFFPAFSVLFGGSQLAGAVIIQNATSINMLILGMIVQVAPLVITPFLLRFSGQLLSRVAGFINDPNKGLLDRTRKWADANREWHRQRGISGMRMNGKPGELRGRNFMRRASRNLNHVTRNLEGRTKNASALADNVYHSSRGYERIHEAAHEIGTDKEIIETRQSRHIQGMINTPGHRFHGQNITLEGEKLGLEGDKTVTARLVAQETNVIGSTLNTNNRRLEFEKLGLEREKTRTSLQIQGEINDVNSTLHAQNMRLESAKMALEVEKARAARQIEEYKSGLATAPAGMETYMLGLANNVAALAAERQGMKSAQYMQQKNVSELFTSNTVAAQALLNIAKGVDPNGLSRAQAEAITALDKLDSDARENNLRLFSHRAATVERVTPKDLAVRLLEARHGGDMSESDEIIRAALEMAGDEAQIPLLRKVRQSANFNQDEVTAMLGRKSTIMKTKGAFDLQADPSLALASDDRMNLSTAAAIGSTSAKDFVGLKNGALIDYARRADELYDAIGNVQTYTTGIDPVTGDMFYIDPTNGQQISQRAVDGAQTGLEKTYTNLTRALSTPEIINELGDNLRPSIELHQKLHAKLYPGTPLPPGFTYPTV